jgi:hypothetical protein
MPMRISRDKGSLMVTGAKKATHKGAVLTNTTELATEVYSKEDIQVAKCTAKKNPERTAREISLRLKEINSLRYRLMANGARMKDAKANLNAAMTREGTPSAWINLMNMEAVETASIPKGIAINGGKIGDSDLFSMLPCLGMALR